jgi:hypothetical protein
VAEPRSGLEDDAPNAAVDEAPVAENFDGAGNDDRLDAEASEAEFGKAGDAGVCLEGNVTDLRKGRLGAKAIVLHTLLHQLLTIGGVGVHCPAQVIVPVEVRASQDLHLLRNHNRIHKSAAPESRKFVRQIVVDGIGVESRRAAGASGRWRAHPIELTIHALNYRSTKSQFILIERGDDDRGSLIDILVDFTISTKKVGREWDICTALIPSELLLSI